jgi:hypothetical protein
MSPRTIGVIALLAAGIAGCAVLQHGRIGESRGAPASNAVSVQERPATPEDLRILDRADQILSDATKWDRADDRVCEPADRTWSLFCALQQATTEVIAQYDHDDRMGQAALREVRLVIEDLPGGRQFQHRLMDFNNLSTTRFEDIKMVLHRARDRVATQLAAQAN